jgi:hypothetical protein
MTTLTLEKNYVEMLQVFGSAEQILNDLVYRYLAEQINQQLQQTQSKIAKYEAKYGLTFEKFYFGITNDLEFLQQLRQAHPMWERDFNLWECEVEELTEWHGCLTKLSKY